MAIVYSIRFCTSNHSCRLYMLREQIRPTRQQRGKSDRAALTCKHVCSCFQTTDHWSSFQNTFHSHSYKFIKIKNLKSASVFPSRTISCTSLSWLLNTTASFCPHAWCKLFVNYLRVVNMQRVSLWCHDQVCSENLSSSCNTFDLQKIITIQWIRSLAHDVIWRLN